MELLPGEEQLHMSSTPNTIAQS